MAVEESRPAGIAGAHRNASSKSGLLSRLFLLVSMKKMIDRSKRSEILHKRPSPMEEPSC